MKDRGVSEVIAFILVFSIVITSVGLLYTAGFGSITQIQETETDRSAERAFGASAIALQDIQRGNGQHRAFDLELSGRTLAVNDSTALNVEVDGTPVSDASASGALVYGVGSGTEIAYQAGAVIRSDGSDAQVVSREPQFRCTEDQAVVTTVTITGPTSSVSTDGSIQLLADGPESEYSTLKAAARGTDSSVTIEYGNTPYDTAWDRFFEDRGWDTSTSGEATCTVDQAVYVRHVPINLEYQGV